MGTFVVPFFSTRMCTCGFWRTSSSSETLRPQKESMRRPACTSSAVRRGSVPACSFPWITRPLMVARMASH